MAPYESHSRRRTPKGRFEMFLDSQSVHLMSHGVLVHHVLVKFLARDLSLDIRDEVLDVLNGLTLLSDLLEVVNRGVVGHEKLVKLGVAHVKNLDEGTELMNLRHIIPFVCVGHAGLSLPKETQTFTVLGNHESIHELLVEVFERKTFICIRTFDNNCKE